MILHPDNFGWYGTGQLLDYWSSAVGTYEVGLYGPFGGPGLAFLDSTAAIKKTAPFPGGVPTGRFIIGVQRYLGALPAARETLVSFGLSGTVHVKIDVNTNGTLSIRRGDDVQIATSTLALVAGQPFHVNVEVEVSNTAGTVYVIVTSVGVTSMFVSATGLDTQNGGSTAWNEYTHEGIGAYSTIGNSVLQDSSGGGAEAAMLGPNLRLHTFRPNRAGAHSQYTHRVGSVENYKNVGDGAAVTFNGTDQVEAMDTFGTPRIDEPGALVYAPTLIIRARKGGTREKRIAPVIVQGGTDVIGPSFALTEDSKPYATIYHALPDGGGWTSDRWNVTDWGYADATPPPVEAWMPGGTLQPLAVPPVVQAPSFFWTPF